MLCKTRIMKVVLSLLLTGDSCLRRVRGEPQRGGQQERSGKAGGGRGCNRTGPQKVAAGSARGAALKEQCSMQCGMHPACIQHASSMVIANITWYLHGIYSMNPVLLFTYSMNPVLLLTYSM